MRALAREAWMAMIREKIAQASGILKEEGIDLWLTFVRESEVTGDPALDLILGANCTWHSAFMIPATGKAVAIVGSLDEARIQETGAYEVVGYVKSIKEPLLEHLNRISPRTIAVNFSEYDCMSDGLSHGMYLSLMRYLDGTPYPSRLVSSVSIQSKLRGRKSPEEIRRIRAAVELAETIFTKVSGIMKPGLSEKDVAAFILG
ncbi:MAG TPA: aminopeptidase P family protein, partial [Candidatus Bathyarchaeia archaeon]|nr:aminopeptidase P family protein [Candidatus Bathyarchaeia archaeon]